MSASQLLDPRLQDLGAVAKVISTMDPSPAAEPSSSSPGLQSTAAKPSDATFRRVSAVQASNIQPPILDYSSKALYVESLAGYYGMFACCPA
jgi:hypothetical protein